MLLQVIRVNYKCNVIASYLGEIAFYTKLHVIHKDPWEITSSLQVNILSVESPEGIPKVYKFL